MRPLTFAQVEDVLAIVHRVRSDKRVAFRARLKHLQREGWPDGANTGTGRRVDYTINSLMQIAMALELMQAGISPRRAVAALRPRWHDTAIALAMAGSTARALAKWGELGDDDWDEIFWVFRPTALQDLSEGWQQSHDDGSTTIRPSELGQYLAEYKNVAGDVPSSSLVIGLKMLRVSISLALNNIDLAIGITDYSDEIMGWDLSDDDRALISSFRAFLSQQSPKER